MKKTISLVIGMYLLIAVSPLLLISPADAAIPAMERQALIDLYNSTAGASWADRTNWNGAPGTECTWHGVYCSSGDRNVTNIILWNNNLIGAVPATLQNLTSLEALNLGMNRLSGAIPPELGNLANLRTLDLR